MKYLYYPFVVYLLLASLLCSCNNKSDEKITVADSSFEKKTSDSSIVSVLSELKEYKELSVDSILIKHQGSLNTLYGVRQNDELIVEGDMKFTYPDNYFHDVQLNEINKKEGDIQQKKSIIKVQGVGIGTTDRLWPKNSNGKINIPFIINLNYKTPKKVLQAISSWEKEGMVSFSEFNGERDFVEFIPSDATQSYVGRVGNHQTIEIGINASSGNIAHEIGHLLGLFHEQSRSDRDQFIQILCPDDINYRFAFLKDKSAKDIGPYNPFSIMHYPETTCMKLKIGGLPPGIPGQRDSITKADFNAIKIIYKISN